MRFKLVSVGIVGRVFGVLLFTVIAGVAANTLLYESFSRLAVHEDEARRAAEHIVVVARALEGQTEQLRQKITRSASTAHFELKWLPFPIEPTPDSPLLEAMHAQMLRWEPTLQASDLRLHTATLDRTSEVIGALRLADDSWLHFKTRGLVEDWAPVLKRLLPASLQALALLPIGWLLLRSVLRPLRLLADAATRMGRSNPMALVEEGPSELRRLIRAYNDMQARISSMLSEKMQALAAVGHDLRTPLARLRLSLDGVADLETRTAMDRDLIEMEQMLGSLLTYYRGNDQPEPLQSVDIAVLAATLIDDLQDQGFSAEYIGPEHCEVTVRALGFKRALSNLIDNARHYGTHTQVAVSQLATKVLIYVDDNGPGIPEACLVRVLEPFQRLDAARSRNTAGVGLGLTIAARTITDVGGTLTLSNLSAGGLRAAIELHTDSRDSATLRHTGAAT